MTALNGRGRVEISAMASVAAAERLAAAAVAAFDACDEAGVPLSPTQRIAIIEAALLEFDGFAAHLSSLAGVRRLLGDIERM
jgi:hypothetical protein